MLNTLRTMGRRFVMLSLFSLSSTGYMGGYLIDFTCEAHAQAIAEKIPISSGMPMERQAPGTPRQQAWLKASIEERVRMSERLGDEGGRAFAKSKGWAPIMDGTNCHWAL